MTREELLAKIEAATGPDRELDVAIMQLCDPLAAPASWHRYGASSREPPVFLHVCAPHVTESIDAALGLVERLLPGIPYFLANDYVKTDAEEPCACDISNKTSNPHSASAPTLPLAILAALLKALRALPPSNEAAR